MKTSDIKKERGPSRQKNGSKKGEHMVKLTKGIAIANLGPPASDQMDLVILHAGHLRVPFANELNILFDLVGLDLVEDDGMDVFATSENGAEAGLDLGIHLPTFLRTVNEVGQAAGLAVGLLFCELRSLFCGSSAK